MNNRTKMLLIRLPYYLGIVADTFWAVALYFPNVFGIITGYPGFNPDIQTQLIMGIGGTLMTGWTILLIWGVLKPIERRFIILITAFPVVFGMFVISVIGAMDGNSSGIWLIIKTVVLMVTMLVSYFMARQINGNNVLKDNIS